MIVFKQRGDFGHVKKFLKSTVNQDYLHILEQYGKEGVAALSNATPVDTGKTASSWSYSIEKSNGKTAIVWSNSNVQRGVSIALILQTGHSTRNGAWVEGRDYINPALRPVFDRMASALWKEVTK